MASDRDDGDPGTPDNRITALADLDRGKLEAEWRRIYVQPPPRRVSRELMVRAIAYHMQVETHGGLDRKTQKRLKQLVAARRSGKSMKNTSPGIKPGTRLFREWNGETYEVLVLEEGFAFRSRVHRSLSAIAKEITGTNWNGHVFFGLKRRSSQSDTENVPEPPAAELPG